MFPPKKGRNQISQSIRQHSFAKEEKITLEAQIIKKADLLLLSQKKIIVNGRRLQFCDIKRFNWHCINHLARKKNLVDSRWNVEVLWSFSSCLYVHWQIADFSSSH